ncbi:winged helix-turn-helix domain-containing protein, partial [Streptomyces sp. NPDC006514]|uniref:helix-turn-helix domain-containing protein n=1 Tax=Streptomyces sp. NPDC006514 TaxID=3154308 RepID=UPI0033BB3D20
MLRRHGWSHQVPARRAVERDEAAVAGWVKEVSRDIGNLAAADLCQITRAVKRRLKQIQYRPDLVDECLSGTGLIMDG